MYLFVCKDDRHQGVAVRHWFANYILDEVPPEVVLDRTGGTEMDRRCRCNPGCFVCTEQQDDDKWIGVITCAVAKFATEWEQLCPEGTAELLQRKWQERDKRLRPAIVPGSYRSTNPTVASPKRSHDRKDSNHLGSSTQHRVRVVAR